jgi:pyrroline-5-carboxylate reductase
MQNITESIIMAGCGHMGGAILRRWLDCGLHAAQVTVVRPSAAAVAPGVRVVGNPAGLAAPNVLVLGFKPQQLAQAAPDFAAMAGPETLVLSLLAGIEIAALRAAFPQAKAILRAMPNLPVAQGKGVVLLQGEAAVARGISEALLAPLGHLHWATPDQDFDVLTALTGCSPAFLFAFTESLADAAMTLGVAEKDALLLATASVAGAAAMAEARSETSPADLISEVASKGGMTQAGIDVLRTDKALSRLLIDTLTASARRGADLRKA